MTVKSDALQWSIALKILKKNTDVLRSASATEMRKLKINLNFTTKQ